MAIQINGSTVIDNSENLILDGSVSGGIIATTAEAQAATADDVIMTPAKVKDLLQGGNASVIKSITRFTVTAGVLSPGVLTWGAGQITRSTDSSVTFSSPDGPSAYFCFAVLGTPVNPNKTFLTYTFKSARNDYDIVPLVRMYTYFGGIGRYPTSAETSWTDIQITNDGTISGGGTPEVSIELVEFY